MGNIDSSSDPVVSGATERQPYVAPRMIAIGNARDLLAGFGGTIEDMVGGDDLQQNSGG